ncbi:MAG: glucose-1-phosphate adenylyltransferase [Chloroflexi bacterium]|nr:glucose-1-phosphate adenylyltransferase [Chloroflexota bacterium]
MSKVISVILAGGAGDRLQPLTRMRAKSAVPFGGKFRLIDFTLSNCVNSGMRRIFVLTQYKSASLQKHIQEGWGISSSGLGDFIYCMPAQQKIGTDWYRGTADAIRQNLDLFKGKDYDHTLILAGDHVYKMDYNLLVDFHRKNDAALTVATCRARKEEAARKLGVLEVDRDYRIIGFEEKPREPRTMPGSAEYVLASLGVYIFSARALIESLRGEEDDFGSQLIPKLVSQGVRVFAYDFAGENRISDYAVEVRDGKRTKTLVDRTRDSNYWRDVGTLEAYYEASMDLVGVDPYFNLYGEKWQLRTYQRPLGPSKTVLDGKALESLVCDGCIISGATVWRSVLSPGVVVERDALVEESIIFDDVTIEPGARIRRAIIDKECVIRAGTTIGYDIEADRRRGYTVSESGIVVVPRSIEVESA